MLLECSWCNQNHPDSGSHIHRADIQQKVGQSKLKKLRNGQPDASHSTPRSVNETDIAARRRTNSDHESKQSLPQVAEFTVMWVLLGFPSNGLRNQTSL
jgi:hypothetical protein